MITRCSHKQAHWPPPHPPQDCLKDSAVVAPRSAFQGHNPSSSWDLAFREPNLGNSCGEPLATAINSGGAPAKHAAYMKSFGQFTGEGWGAGRYVVMVQPASKQSFTGLVFPFLGASDFAGPLLETSSASTARRAESNSRFRHNWFARRSAPQ